MTELLPLALDLMEIEHFLQGLLSDGPLASSTLALHRRVASLDLVGNLADIHMDDFSYRLPCSAIIEIAIGSFSTLPVILDR